MGKESRYFSQEHIVYFFQMLTGYIENIMSTQKLYTTIHSSIT